MEESIFVKWITSLVVVGIAAFTAFIFKLAYDGIQKDKTESSSQKKPLRKKQNESIQVSEEIQKKINTIYNNFSGIVDKWKSSLELFEQLLKQLDKRITRVEENIDDMRQDVNIQKVECDKKFTALLRTDGAIFKDLDKQDKEIQKNNSLLIVKEDKENKIKINQQYSSTCLVVDDYDDLRNLYIKDFEELGYDCSEADSYNNALSLLRQYNGFNYAIIDIRLDKNKKDKRTGIQLANFISKNYPKTNVILCSAFGQPENLNDNVIYVNKNLSSEEFTKECHKIWKK